MNKLIELLMNINPTIDYMNETHLIDHGLLDSLSILSIVTELEGEFDIDISPVDLVPANFNSAKSLLEMIERLQGS